MFYLANSYFDLGDTANALEFYKRRLTINGWPQENFYSSYRIGMCYQRLERESEMIMSWLHTFEKFPHRAEPLHALGLHFQKQGRHRLAYHFAEIGSHLPAPAGALFLESEVYTWRLLDIMAVSLYYMDRRIEGLYLNRQLLEMVPETQRARILQNLAFCEKG